MAGRHCPWCGITADEGFEIVRRRLFEPIDPENYRHRDATIDQFIKLYRDNTADFPSECAEGEYKRRMVSAYPIHPELFDKLYSVWGSLEKFQKTRGVLRLMAMVINYLWENGDNNPLILPANVPVNAVQGELNRYTEETWQAIIQNDIDSDQSAAMRIDRENPRLGKVSAARKVARTVFLGSAPTHKDERGIEVQRINLGCIQPGENIPNYSDALNKLRDTATFLHFEGNRVWFSTRPNVSRMATDRADQVEDFHVEDEIVRRLKSFGTKGDFAGIHAVPKTTDDVPDEMETRLVILGPSATYNSKEPENAALQKAKEILQHRGSSQRVFRNTLIFAAPDDQNLVQLKQNVRLFLAWQSIAKDEETLQLTPQLKKQATDRKQSYDETVNAGIKSTWIWVLYPHQVSAQEDVQWESSRVNGQEDIIKRISKKMLDEGALTTELGPRRLHLDLEKYLWKNVPHLNTRKLAEYFASYLYLPKIRDRQVLQKCINDELHKLIPEFFAYAEAFNQETGRYEGLISGKGGNAIIDNDSVIIKLESIKNQLATPVAGAIQSPDGTVNPSPENLVTLPQSDTKERPTMFVGSVELDADRVGRDAAKIAEEVLSHLTSIKGAKAKVTMEIEVQVPAGIEDSIQRAVVENCNVLKVKIHNF